jgi:hypothetical protein
MLGARQARYGVARATTIAGDETPPGLDLVVRCSARLGLAVHFCGTGGKQADDHQGKGEL